MIVIDYTIVDFHGGDKTELFILALFNMVSRCLFIFDKKMCLSVDQYKVWIWMWGNGHYFEFWVWGFDMGFEYDCICRISARMRHVDSGVPAWVLRDFPNQNLHSALHFHA